ncbi:hypothetical protein SIL08_15145 [Scandinavium sp. V105_16]|uniref:Uncharacterized protein n=1 Tax=Scandinavium lactucae TaxID=3095028 RepID=A0AAJ2S8D7_9ENTR|nr:MULTISPECIES: hypothetical protein [unclassified Scandinavium]MDX6021611.1 hypothetical protein [Scandinavium sp. V105_16]MDX6031776.1 hypothetical protein [Scandinavium sp. V105_12]MDX6038706.1 hypothetical protein [Scandinavium sp. V105_6]MDX6049338.1 hypothetical protein [Scandinavium sp. V105_1]
MSDIISIADRIVDVIVSPNTISGLISGATSVPVDLGYLVQGFFDTDSHSRYHRETERIRMMSAVKHDLLNYEHLKEAVTIILREFETHVSVGEKDAFYSRTVFAVLGRISTNSLLSSKITNAILDEASFLANMRNSLFIGNVMLIGGMMERSIRTSDRLAASDPYIYDLLRARDYDLLYFLIEPAMKPFVDALNVRQQGGQPQFDKIIKRVEERLHGQ